MANTETKNRKSYGNASTDENLKRSERYQMIKRLSDVLLSLMALVLLFPVFLLTAAAIKLEDGGKVFYTQKRIGKDEKVFNMYKFRSMREDAEKIHAEMALAMGNTEVSFKPKEDPRITRVGKFIRRTNIDELPQLVNILKGEMSIVGPRPLPVYEYEEERKRYGNTYQKRYQVSQGLTCYWQVEERAETTFEERMQMDVNYASDCCTWLDICLTVKTMLAIIRGRAGY